MSYQDYWQTRVHPYVSDPIPPTNASHPGIFCRKPRASRGVPRIVATSPSDGSKLTTPNGKSLSSKASTEPGSSSPDGSDRQPSSSPDDSADESCSSSPPISYDTPPRPCTPEEDCACGEQKRDSCRTSLKDRLERAEKPGRAVGLWGDPPETLTTRADPRGVLESKPIPHYPYPRSGLAFTLGKSVASCEAAAQAKGRAQGNEMRDLENEMAELTRDLPVKKSMSSKASTEPGSSSPDVSDRQPSSSPDDSADESCSYSPPISYDAAPAPAKGLCGAQGMELRDIENEMLELARDLPAELHGGAVPHHVHPRMHRLRALVAARAEVVQGAAGTELRDLESEIAELTRDLPMAPEVSLSCGKVYVPARKEFDYRMSVAPRTAAPAKGHSRVSSTELRDFESEMAELVQDLPKAPEDGPSNSSVDHSIPEDVDSSVSAARAAAAQAKGLSGALTSELRDLEDEMAELTRELLAIKASVPDE